MNIMSIERENSMEVDLPVSHSHGQGNTNLKRSNSAPMINVLVNTTQSPQEISHHSHTQTFRQAGDTSRIRRFSSSSLSLNSPIAAPVKIPNRVNEIKREESFVTVAEKEKEQERDICSQLKMSTSWNDFSLDEPMMPEVHKRPRSFSETLHIFTSPNMLASAPSPTRVGPGRQCFSPSMQKPVVNSTFTPSPSPSPTRKNFIRSLSPIAVRPSPLGKRRLDHDSSDGYISPAKKFHIGPITPDKVMHVHPLAHSHHSVSSSSLEDGSPEQTVPKGNNTQDIRLRYQHQPNMYTFMPLGQDSRDSRDSQDMQTTDSETSDITDISDPNISLSASPSTSGFQPIKHTQV
ncbi:P2R1A-PPP2R2A-interacting phosphatase regulator 1-like [Mytilus edulis]|uniref:P2R1A-PPP2R2A-interacting phosphatase regulator 1-like n=1 Tax=Mytilus edulis TaxID=6550 RepID=UPI0039EF78BD